MQLTRAPSSQDSGCPAESAFLSAYAFTALLAFHLRLIFRRPFGRQVCPLQSAASSLSVRFRLHLAPSQQVHIPSNTKRWTQSILRQKCSSSKTRRQRWGKQNLNLPGAIRQV